MRAAAPLLRLLALATLVVGAFATPTRPVRADGRPAAEPKPAPLPRLVGPRVGPAAERAKPTSRLAAEVEKAIDAGLGWLARHQGEDGRWDADGFPSRCDPKGPACDGVGKGQHGEEMPCPFDGAISAIATLAFLGAGHGPWVEGDPYGSVVERALEALRGSGDVWALPLGLEAFAEAEIAEGKGRFADEVASRAKRLLDARQPDGAWAYAAGFRRGSDVPYSSLVVPALVAARDAGVALPDDLAPNVDRWLSSLEEEQGRLAYLADGRAYGYTPTASNALGAAAIRELLEVGRGSTRHQAHLRVARRDPPDWTISFKEVPVKGRGTLRVQVGHLSLLEWWLGTEAMSQAGGDGGRAWTSRLVAALLGHQRPSGCARGSWDPLGTYERQTGGRVFATALCVRMLETPVRRRRLDPTPR